MHEVFFVFLLFWNRPNNALIITVKILLVEFLEAILGRNSHLTFFTIYINDVMELSLSFRDNFHKINNSFVDALLLEAVERDDLESIEGI